jgi:hypothetical protein
MMRLLLIAFFLEVGIALVLIPWSPFWDRNYFAQWLPWLHALMTNNFVRGAVSGVGVLNVVAGIVELAATFMARRSPESIISIGRQPAAEE